MIAFGKLCAHGVSSYDTLRVVMITLRVSCGFMKDTLCVL